MRFFIGLIVGFIIGCTFTVYHVVEVPNGVTVKVMQFAKTLWEVF